jgi:hypothetical protein
MNIKFDYIDMYNFDNIEVQVGRKHGTHHDEDGGTSAGPVIYGAWIGSDIMYAESATSAIAALFNAINRG